MEIIIMTLLRWSRPLFRGSGIDHDQVMAIVLVKLKMDKRRVYMNWRAGQQKKESNQLLRALFFYALMGLFMGSLIFAVDNYLTVMVFLHGYFLFMMSMTLITDFSAVLLDTTDNQVILPRPVSSRTLFVARLLHIMLYLLQFAVAISAGSWIFTFIRHGLVAGFVLMVTSLLTVLLAVFLTWFLYLSILRFASEQRLKDIITYFQIGMTVLFTLGFQVFPRMINMVDLQGSVSFGGWTYALPPVWMALANEAFASHIFDVLHLTMIGLALVVPLVGFWVLNRFLAPVFARKLSALQGSSGPDMPGADVDRPRQASASISSRLSPIFCTAGTERGSFETGWRITGRDKGFRMQFYPGLAYILVFFFIFVLRGKGDVMENWRGLPGTRNFLWLIYLPMMTISSGFTLASFNEHFNAAWIYHSSPLERPGELISGLAKTIIVKFFLPVWLILSAVNLWIWGIGVWDDVLFGFAANLFCYFCFVSISEHYLPFSRQPNVRQQSGRFAKTILQLLLVSALVGLHYLLVDHGVWLLTAVPVLALGTHLLIRRIRGLHWAAIKI